jgi:hypothetical protein
MSGISPTASLLASYDPTNPTSIDSSLTGAGLSDSYYQQGVNGTGSYDPGVEGPTAAAPLSATPAASSSSSSSSSSGSSSSSSGNGSSSTSNGLNVYQQALASLQQWADQTLIESALGGSSTSSSSGDDPTSVTDELEAAAEAQATQQQQQQQASLAAAQSALDAGTNVDTSA